MDGYNELNQTDSKSILALQQAAKLREAFLALFFVNIEDRWFKYNE